MPPVTPNDDAGGRLRDDPDARAGMDPDALAEHVAAQVAAAPPLGPRQIDRLRRLLRGPGMGDADMRG